MSAGENRDAFAYQRFLAASRNFWGGELFSALRRQVGVQAAELDADRFRAFVERHPTHRMFAWLERHLQRMRYSGPFGLVETAQHRRGEWNTSLSKALPAGLLHLDPDVVAPDWYRAYDIHQHPGGLAGDALAGVVYRDAVASGVVGQPGLHDRFAQRVLEGRAPTRILDLGCGFGRSTLAFARSAPAAHVQGIDLSAGCLTLAAHETPDELRERVSFTQANVLANELPSQAFDIVTSTMLLHEMPEPAVRALIEETGRLVAPGGVVAHLDFLPPDDPLLRILFEGHARRNNEPYLLEHARVDRDAAYAAAGFADVEAFDFAEADDALDPQLPRWRLPWKLIVATKPAASR